MQFRYSLLLFFFFSPLLAMQQPIYPIHSEPIPYPEEPMAVFMMRPPPPHMYPFCSRPIHPLNPDHPMHPQPVLSFPMLSMAPMTMPYIPLPSRPLPIEARSISPTFQQPTAKQNLPDLILEQQLFSPLHCSIQLMHTQPYENKEGEMEGRLNALSNDIYYALWLASQGYIQSSNSMLKQCFNAINGYYNQMKMIHSSALNATYDRLQKLEGQINAGTFHNKCIASWRSWNDTQ